MSEGLLYFVFADDIVFVEESLEKIETVLRELAEARSQHEVWAEDERVKNQSSNEPSCTSWRNHNKWKSN